MAPRTQTSARCSAASQGACPSAALAAAAAAAAATEAAGAAGEVAGTPEQQLTGRWDGEHWVTKRASASVRASVLSVASHNEKDPCHTLVPQAASAGEHEAGSRRASQQPKESIAQQIKRLSIQEDALPAILATKDVPQEVKWGSVAEDPHEGKRASVASLEQIAQQIRRMSVVEAQQEHEQRQQHKEPETEEQPREEFKEEACKEEMQLVPKSKASGQDGKPQKDVQELAKDGGMQTPRAHEVVATAEVQIKVERDHSRKLLKRVKLDADLPEQSRALVWTFGRHSGHPELPGARVRVLKGPWKEEGERLGIHRGDLLVSINGVAVAELREAAIKDVWRAQQETGSLLLELQEELAK